MKILVRNTIEGLVPLFDEDYDNKKKLKLGQDYKVQITKARNIDFHRKYFALINTGWEFLNEEQAKFFHNSREGFRKSVQIAAGYFEKVYSINRGEWIEESISISFDSMDEFEFRELYQKVRDIIFTLIERNVTEEEFIMHLADF